MSEAPAAVERWLPVVGFEADYEVSDMGRVRSRTRVKVYTRRDQYSGRSLTITRHHTGYLLKPAAAPSGHLSVVLGRANTKQVHALVLEAFVGPRPDGEESLHGDGDPANNRLSNLRWGTRSENIADAIAHGAIRVGERHRSAKLRDADVRAIRSLFGIEPYLRIAERYGVSDTTIRQIAYGRTWRHVQ